MIIFTAKYNFLSDFSLGWIKSIFKTPDGTPIVQHAQEHNKCKLINVSSKYVLLRYESGRSETVYWTIIDQFSFICAKWYINTGMYNNILNDYGINCNKELLLFRQPKCHLTFHNLFPCHVLITYV